MGREETAGWLIGIGKRIDCKRRPSCCILR